MYFGRIMLLYLRQVHIPSILHDGKWCFFYQTKLKTALFPVKTASTATIVECWQLSGQNYRFQNHPERSCTVFGLKPKNAIPSNFFLSYQCIAANNGIRTDVVSKYSFSTEQLFSRANDREFATIKQQFYMCSMK